jgi:hypothetical protein
MNLSLKILSEAEFKMNVARRSIIRLIGDKKKPPVFLAVFQKSDLNGFFGRIGLAFLDVRTGFYWIGSVISSDWIYQIYASPR